MRTDPRKLVVATYNVHGCVGTDGKYDPERVARVIRELDADLVGLQEVDSRRHPGGVDSQLEYLAYETGHYHVGGPTIVTRDGHYGNALLSRFPFSRVRHESVAVVRREPRALLDVELEALGMELRVVVTHFGLAAAERRHQTDRLLSHIDRHRGPMTIVVGDFNEWFLPSRILRHFRRHFGHTPAPRTFPSRLPLFSLDRVFVDPRQALISVRALTRGTARVASDHLPVRAVVALAKRDGLLQAATESHVGGRT